MTRRCCSPPPTDGEWDPYIDDFANQIPDYIESAAHGLRGLAGNSEPEVKDWIVARQVPAAAWYVANPNLTVVGTKRLERVGKALDEFLDKVG